MINQLLCSVNLLLLWENLVLLEKLFSFHKVRRRMNYLSSVNLDQCIVRQNSFAEEFLWKNLEEPIQCQTFKETQQMLHTPSHTHCSDTWKWH